MRGDDPDTLRGEELVEYRLARRMTQAELAAEMGVHRVTLARRERNATSVHLLVRGPARRRARSEATEYRRRSRERKLMHEAMNGPVVPVVDLARVAAAQRALAKAARELAAAMDSPRLCVLRDGRVRFGRPSEFGLTPEPLPRWGSPNKRRRRAAEDDDGM